MSLKKFLGGLLLIIPFGWSYTLINNTKKELKKVHTDPPFVKYSSKWVDSVFNSLTLEQKIGQLFMVEVYPNSPSQSRVEELIKKYNIGGIIYFKGSPTKVGQLTNYFQSITKVPLMTAIDGEWGVAMRLDSVEAFPRQLMLGAIQDNELIYKMGEEIAYQCQVLGININFAPVVDINNNSLNPVIGVRSFGEDKNNVTKKAYLYAQALQDNNILPVIKHFPGHGNTSKDSHKELPTINTRIEQLDTIELFPFKELINAGIGGVMIAHLYVPAIDNTPNTPSTLSSKIINDLLIKKMKFKGLVFTDAMNMKGFTKYTQPGKAEVQAILAGNDILLMPKDVPLAFDSILNAVKTGVIPISVLNQKVYKIIAAKYWMGLNNFTQVDINNIINKLNRTEGQYINRKLVENSLTLLTDKNNVVPFKNIEKIKIGCISIIDTNFTIFQDYLNRYAKIEHYNIRLSSKPEQFDSLANIVNKYDYLIVSVHSNKDFSINSSYGITAQTVDFVNKLATTQKVIFVLFANPYSLRYFKNYNNFEAILLSYENSKISQQLSAQLLFGGIKSNGKLPININKNFKIGFGLQTTKIRLKYSLPEELNINYTYLNKIDTLIQTSIENHIFPGCQIMAIKDGIVFFDKQYGYHTYDKQEPVCWDDLYDIASVTKVASTTLSLMTLYEQNKFDINAPINQYLPQLEKSNKSGIKNIDILTHQARLMPYTTFFHYALNPDGSWNSDYIDTKQTEKCNIKVAENVFVSIDFQKIYLQRNFDSNLLRRKKYKYSDIGFILYRFVIENITKKNLDIFVKDNFYEPLGCSRMTYKPLENGIQKNKIVPSEIDTKYRKQVIQGYVNDFGAAILGNVSGHAGLFSTANDLAIIFQMLLQKGFYADRQYFLPSTIKTFTTPPFHTSHRGLGFDTGNKSSACSMSSNQSFGHTGFTGCIVWADPQYNFIYIFLSNRTFPDAENKEINNYKIRQQVQSLLYHSFIQVAK